MKRKIYAINVFMNNEKDEIIVKIYTFYLI